METFNLPQLDRLIGPLFILETVVDWSDCGRIIVIWVFFNFFIKP